MVAAKMLRRMQDFRDDGDSRNFGEISISSSQTEPKGVAESEFELQISPRLHFSMETMNSRLAITAAKILSPMRDFGEDGDSRKMNGFSIRLYGSESKGVAESESELQT